MRRILIRTLIVGTILAIIAIPLGYVLGKKFIHSYAEKWAIKLISLDQKGLLSQSFGAAWQDVVYGDEMNRKMNALDGTENQKTRVTIIEGIPVEDYPSLDVIRRLNEISSYSNQIRIEDRKGRPIARIMTDHQRMPFDSFPNTLVQAVVAAEDNTFFENNHGFSYDSFVRAALRAIQESVKSFGLKSPRGTSTLTQQVGKMLVSQLDTEGRRYVSRSLDRKKREIQIAAALRKLYSPEAIMEVYLNHSLTSSDGLIGAADIAMGLWETPISDISDAQSVYLARMVKWGMNFPDKIKRQCHIDMPRIQSRLGWSDAKKDSVLQEIDSLTFLQPRTVKTEEGYLVDLANLYWLKFLEIRGTNKKDLRDFDLLNANSLVRQKGNVTIRMNIDLPLQKFLVEQVEKRGFGDDTTVINDVRIGSEGVTVAKSFGKMRDTLRLVEKLSESRTFSEPESEKAITLKPGDTLITNIRYKKQADGSYRRSLFYYARQPLHMGGQYFGYAMMDAQSGKLRAYYSRDRIGSRAAALLSRSTPNGSSTTKPIINALMYDLGYYAPISRWSDTTPPQDPNQSWFWTLDKTAGKMRGDAYFKSAQSKGKPYRVHNHGSLLEGDLFVYDQLAVSNNILAVENIYRLNTVVFDTNGKVTKEGSKVARLLYRLGLYDTFKKSYAGKKITGVRVYKELARTVGADVDSVGRPGRKSVIPDDRYSIALGTLQLTLLEQLHLFNVLYNNTIYVNPKEHPSLFISHVTLNGEVYSVDALDKVDQIHPFASIDNIRPSLLALHKRLTSNRYDGLNRYDILLDTTRLQESLEPDDEGVVYPPEVYPAQGYSNFAKSGTTDDIIRPYNVDASSKKKTNYGLWNGVVRIDLSKFSDEEDSIEIADITIACVGEGNRKNTGVRDGKTLHKFTTKSLLKQGGIPVRKDIGFYHTYKNEIDRAWQEDIRQKAVLDSLATLVVDTTIVSDTSHDGGDSLGVASDTATVSN